MEHIAEKDARPRVWKVNRVGWAFFCRACRHGSRCASHGEAFVRAEAHVCHDHDVGGGCIAPGGGPDV